MSIYLIEAELKVRHLYSVEATSEEEAKKFIEVKERHQHEYGPGITVLDKVWLGNIENKIIDVKEIWEEK
ncbi:hypothetical protein ABFP60_02070 [Clostridioides difficile]